MPARNRPHVSPADRRDAILDAALDVFSAQGFAAARLEDVAARAGIAKGTVYLHFRSKQDLFEQLVYRTAGPLLDRLEGLADAPELPVPDVIAVLHRLFAQEVLATRRKEVLRLVLAEGQRFPQIAAFYHREVISRGLPLLRAILGRGLERGELRDDSLVRFPHLIFAPLVMAVLWDGLFERVEHLDVSAMLDAHRTLLFGPTESEDRS